MLLLFGCQRQLRINIVQWNYHTSISQRQIELNEYISTFTHFFIVYVLQTRVEIDKAKKYLKLSGFLYRFFFICT